MKTRVLCSSWYGDREKVLEFPDHWSVVIAEPRGGEVLTDNRIRNAFLSPIGTERVSALARNKRSVILITDDISRPTPVYRLLPFILEELRKGGTSEDQVKIIVGNGGHRPQAREDFIKKLGREAADTFQISAHNPYDNLVSLGISSRGIPIQINKDVMSADLKIGIGCIVPHPSTGFGGGAKIILPGVAGIDTIVAHHKLPGEDAGILEGNECRANLEEVAERVGLDIIVNVLVNGKKDIIGLFVGHFVEAHRAGVAAARELYSTELPQGCDLVVANAYPMDTELFQCGKGMWPGFRCTRPGGAILVLAECPEGKGYHAVFQKSGRFHWYVSEDEMKTNLKGRRIGWISSNLHIKDFREHYPECVSLYRSWEEAMECLQPELNGNIRAALFPCATIQV